MPDEERTPALTGGCQCGAVRYALYSVPTEPGICHCRMCQKAVGNYFAAFSGVKCDELTWTRGAPAIFKSSDLVERGFCRDCGTPLTFEYLGSEKIDLTVGSLDEPERLRPVAHYGFEGCVSAFFTEDGLPRSRTEDSEWLVARWKAAHGDDSAPGPLYGPHT